MNKNELVRAVAEKTSLTQKDVAYVLDEVLATVQEALVAGDEVALSGFGKFVVKHRAARESLNPRTKEKIHVPASKTVGFKVSKPVKDAVNQ